MVGAALGVAGAMLQGALGQPARLARRDRRHRRRRLRRDPDHARSSPARSRCCRSARWSSACSRRRSSSPSPGRGRNRGSVGRLILAGIAIASLFTAGTTALMAAYPDRVPSAIFFIAGGLTSRAGRTWRSIWPYFAVGFVLAVVLIAAARPARARRRRRRLARLAAAPDPARRRRVGGAAGRRPRRRSPAARLPRPLRPARRADGRRQLQALLRRPRLGARRRGAAAAGDTLARTLRAPIEMPVGPLMVLLGVPLFLWLLRKARRDARRCSRPAASTVEIGERADPARRRPELVGGRARRGRRAQRRRQVDARARRRRPAEDGRRHRALVGRDLASCADASSRGCAPSCRSGCPSRRGDRARSGDDRPLVAPGRCGG